MPCRMRHRHLRARRRRGRLAADASRRSGSMMLRATFASTGPGGEPRRARRAPGASGRGRGAPNGSPVPSTQWRRGEDRLRGAALPLPDAVNGRSAAGGTADPCARAGEAVRLPTEGSRELRLGHAGPAGDAALRGFLVERRAGLLPARPSATVPAKAFRRAPSAPHPPAAPWPSCGRGCAGCRPAFRPATRRPRAGRWRWLGAGSSPCGRRRRRAGRA